MPSDLAVKFRKLKILYNEGLKYEGWNNYEKINLKYKNQVICTKTITLWQKKIKLLLQLT